MRPLHTLHNHRNTLTDLLEGLFTIAMADARFHPAEDEYLEQVARIFGLDARCYRAMRARFVDGAPRDPYDVLGLPHSATLDQARDWAANDPYAKAGLFQSVDIREWKKVIG